jgi:hypothetical protein
MNRIMKPKAVAVIGASAEPGKVGNSVMKNLIGGGYKGQICPINPSAGHGGGIERPRHGDAERGRRSRPNEISWAAFNSQPLAEREPFSERLSPFDRGVGRISSQPSGRQRGQSERHRSHQLYAPTHRKDSPRREARAPFRVPDEKS